MRLSNSIVKRIINDAFGPECMRGLSRSQSC